jgi:hypothetical protein
MAFIEYEREIVDSRRAFEACQALFPQEPRDKSFSINDVSWFGTDLVKETGFVAVVNQFDASLRSYVGEFIQIDYDARKVVYYVIGSADIETDFAVSRRGYLALAPLYRVPFTAVIRVTA